MTTSLASTLGWGPLTSANNNMLKTKPSYSIGKQSLIAADKTWSTTFTMPISIIDGSILHLILDLVAP